MALSILIVDDEESVLRGCEFLLKSSGFRNVTLCQDSREAIPVINSQLTGVVLLDLTMPYVSGEELLGQISSEYPDIPVIIVTGHNDVEKAVRCMRNGAFDYLVKPVEKESLEASIRRALEIRELRIEHETFKKRILHNELENKDAFAPIVSINRNMRALFQYIESVAVGSRSILITGETGVGKGLFAKAIHDCSGRTGEFVSVTIAGLDETAFTDTLFGHVKGAFTGADQPRKGLVEQAKGGTLFLDEIGDLNLQSQVKLLRLLQEGEFLPLGSDIPKRSEARVVVATNQDLKEMQNSGQFRRDLYYRLQAHEVHVLPLRERLEDLPYLVEHFLEKAACEFNKKKPTTPKELVTLLASYHFPGNVRELEALVYDAVGRHEAGVLSTSPFKERIKVSREELQEPISSDGQSPFTLFDSLPTLKSAQAMLIEEAMRRADNNQSVAAQMLGISQPGLSKALRRVREDSDSGE